MNTTSQLRRRRLLLLAQTQDGMVHRRQLYALGFTRSQVRAELRARRWRRHGRQSICLHTGPVSRRAEFFRAVFEAGGGAAVDG